MDRSDDELVTVPEVKRRVGVDRPVDKAIQSGALPAYRLGGWPRVYWSDALAWLESTRITPKDGSD